MSRPDYVPDDAEDITNYGAEPNSDDDDVDVAERNREAIIAAANESSGTNVYVPAGTFHIGRSGSGPRIRFGTDADAGGSIYGDGPEESVIAISARGDTSRVQTMFEFESDEDHGTCEFHGVQLYGNAGNLDNPGDGIDCKGDNNLSLRLERVYFNDIYMRAIRARDIDLEARWCTFERIAIERNVATDGSSISHAISWNPSDGNELDLERCRFVNIAGNPINDSSPKTDIRVRWSYVEGVGTGWSKLTAADLRLEHCYIKAHTDEFESLMESGHDGRKAWYVHDGDSATVVMDHVKVEDTTEFGVGVRNGREVTITGDNVAFHNIGFARESRGCFWERNSGSSDEINWDSFGSLSVHGVSGGDDPVFQTPNASGDIESLSWDDADGVGSTGSLSIDNIDDGGEPLEPDVPSFEETGHNGSADGNPSSGNEPDEPLYDDWSLQWESGADDWDVVEGDAFAGDHALTFEHDGGQRARYALSCDRLGEPDDVEVLDKFRVPEFTDDSDLGFHARSHIRTSGRPGSADGYWVEVENRENAFRLAKYTDGRLSTMERFGTPEEDTFYFRRFRAVGSDIKVKIWPADELEPSDWDVETSDDDHSSGWVGLGSFDAGRVEFDVFSVGLDGTTAPFPESVDESTVELAVEADEPSEVDNPSATLNGLLTSLEGVDAARVGFEWGVEGDDLPHTTEVKSLEETETFEAELSELEADTSYEFRAFAEADGVRETSDIVSFETSEGNPNPVVPTIEEFHVSDRSSDDWQRYDVDWEVAHEDGKLDTVVTKLITDDNVVAAESTSVAGDSAAFSHILRVRGEVDEVRVSVNDTDNAVMSEAIEV